MLFNYVIFHRSDLNLDGKGIIREAVRAVIFEEKNITLAYLNKNEEYKFPGGGVREGESFEEALRKSQETMRKDNATKWIKRETYVLNELRKK